jgi:signal transduction histidine kinase
LSVLLASVSAEFEAQRSILVDVAPDVPKVWADADKLRLVIVNLLSNAVKYSPAGGPVEVRVHLGTQNYVEILVEDRGIGMTPDQIEHIFDRFYRVDPNSTVTGSGLGMALVKEIIDIHQGVVSVTPRPGGGLRVRVSLLTVAEESVIRMAEDKIIDNSEK